MSIVTTPTATRGNRPAANGHLLDHPFQICLPTGLNDLESYRRWERSAAYPRHGAFAFLDGMIWVDLSREQLFTHNQVKAEYSMVLRFLVKSGCLGYMFVDRASLSNPGANLACEPDATFVAHATLDTEKVRVLEGAEHGYVELQGTPDMVLEIVSDGSVTKDTVLLRELYWRAGIAEFWLVDVRGETVRFDLLRWTKKSYTVTRKQADGWVKSAVFNRSFLLTRGVDERGYPEFTLAVRE